jgi:tripartite-type tricarboxylate transporter receptor subunit TctC
MKLVALVATMLTLAGALPASAQTYPSHTVHLVVAYAAGGTGDIVARLISDKLAAALGQSVVVENRAGASGAIGARSVAGAAPDGHTLLVGQTGEMSINQHWLKDLGYDPDTDFQPVALASVAPLALVVPGNVPYSTLPDLVKVLRAGERKLSYASAGGGTPGYFAAELLKFKTGSNATHVPYRGAGPALNDVLGGHVDFYFSGFPAAAPHVKAGTMKVLAVSSARRSAVAPEVPTVAEAAGIANFDFTLWAGFFAPRATPGPVVARLNAEINAIIASADTKARMFEMGAEVTPMSVDQVAAFVRTESGKYVQIIKEAGLKPD